MSLTIRAEFMKAGFHVSIATLITLVLMTVPAIAHYGTA